MITRSTPLNSKEEETQNSKTATPARLLATRDAAKQLHCSPRTLAAYAHGGAVSPAKGGSEACSPGWLWSEQDVQRARELLEQGKRKRCRTTG